MREEQPLRSSVEQFEEFLKSTVWADMQVELGIWLEGVRDGLESVDAEISEVHQLQGRANAIRYALSLPETIRDQLVEERQEREENRDE